MKKQTVCITVNTQYEKIHRYDNAPEAVRYLRYPHRHTFYVSVSIQVYSNDRELEFILCKHNIDSFIANSKDEWAETSSCEMMARYILNFLEKEYGEHRLYKVSVFEDNENGATIEEG